MLYSLNEPGRWKNVNSPPGDEYRTLPMMSHRAEPHCPNCKGLLIRKTATAVLCLKCQSSFTQKDGVEVEAVG